MAGRYDRGNFGAAARVVVRRGKENHLLMPLVLLVSVGRAVTPPTARSMTGDPPVQLWLSSDGDYEYGARAKVHARAARDGYLIVVQADADGRVRVLFPLDPQGQQQVRSGKKYELKGRGDREAFVVTDSGGRGTVLAAFSQTPFRFDQFAKAGHWDYAALSDPSVKVDPEAGLLDIVQRMQAADEHFDYDVSTYTAAPRRARPWGPYPDPYPDPYSYFSPYAYYGPGWWGYGFGGLGLSWGWRY